MGSWLVEKDLVGGGSMYFRRTTFKNAKILFDYLRGNVVAGKRKLAWRSMKQLSDATGLDRKSIKACVIADALIKRKRGNARFFRCKVKFWGSNVKGEKGLCANRVALSLVETRKARQEVEEKKRNLLKKKLEKFA